MNCFDHVPDEILECIFLEVGDVPRISNNDHVAASPDSLYFDYSMHHSLLKQNYSSLRSISLVSQRFYRVLKSSKFWQRKCRHDNILLRSLTLPSEFIAYEKLYITNPFHPSFNFIEENQWTKSASSKLQIEPVPIGAHRLYDAFNRPSSCLATSYHWSHIHQRNLKLLPKPLSFNDLVCVKPIIEFSICVAPRFDCASECHIVLIFSDGHHWECRRRFPQWNDKKWHRLVYQYKQYESFPSSVTVTISGRDNQFWAGFYGAKFAQAQLRLLCQNDSDGKNQEKEIIIEPKVEDEINVAVEENPVMDNLPVEQSHDEDSSSY